MVNCALLSEYAFIIQLPICLGVVSNEDYNGNISKNLFQFGNYTLHYISVLDGNLVFPTKLYDPKFDVDMCERSYVSFFTDLNRFHKSPKINIDISEYKNGYACFAVDSTPDLYLVQFKLSSIKRKFICRHHKFDVLFPKLLI